jgi:hypothetical protein
MNIENAAKTLGALLAEYLRLREVVEALGVRLDLLLPPKAEFDRRREWVSSWVHWAACECIVRHDSDIAACRPTA